MKPRPEADPPHARRAGTDQHGSTRTTAEAGGAPGSALHLLTCFAAAVGVPPELLSVRRLARPLSVEETAAALAMGARDDERRGLLS